MNFIQIRIHEPEGGYVSSAVLEVFEFDQMQIEAGHDVIVVSRHQPNLRKIQKKRFSSLNHSKHDLVK